MRTDARPPPPHRPIAADAILVGDPGRALLLAQELLEQPKMSNHARGLWGYSGRTAAGEELTIQATGMGGPSAALVLADLAELGVRARGASRHLRRAGRGERELGELLLVEQAIAAGGSAASFGLDARRAVEPDAELLERLRERAGRDAAGVVASLDTLPSRANRPPEAHRRRHADRRRARPRARARGRRRRGADRQRSSGRRARSTTRQLEAAAKRAGRAAASRTLTLKSRVSLSPLAALLSASSHGEFAELAR